MEELNSSTSKNALDMEEQEPKWDYTSSEQTLFLGAVVVGLNLLVIAAFVLDRYVPAVHSFISGKA